MTFTGGLSDLTIPEEEMDQWVQDMIKFIREAATLYPNMNMLGLCWGHQVIRHALEGQIGTRKGGPSISPESVIKYFIFELTTL